MKDIYQKLEKRLVEDFVLPLINDPEHFEFIYQQFVDANSRKALNQWLLLKYTFEYDGEFQVRHENQEFFSEYLLSLIITVIRSKKLPQPEYAQTT